MDDLKKIMIIDDNELDIFIHKKIFQSLGPGYVFYEFGGGYSALKYLKELSHHQNIPQLILLNISMPVMDGFQFLNEYSKLNNINKEEIKIFILSSSVNPEEIMRAKTSEFSSGFIRKPLTLEKVWHILSYYNTTLNIH